MSFGKVKPLKIPQMRKVTEIAFRHFVSIVVLCVLRVLYFGHNEHKVVTKGTKKSQDQIG